MSGHSKLLTDVTGWCVLTNADAEGLWTSCWGSKTPNLYHVCTCDAFNEVWMIVMKTTGLQMPPEVFWCLKQLETDLIKLIQLLFSSFLEATCSHRVLFVSRKAKLTIILLWMCDLETYAYNGDVSWGRGRPEPRPRWLMSVWFYTWRPLVLPTVHHWGRQRCRLDSWWECLIQEVCLLNLPLFQFQRLIMIRWKGESSRE